MSPKAWKASFSEFHRNYSPRTGQRSSFRSPDKPRRGTLSRESSMLAVSSQSPPLGKPLSQSRELDTTSCHSENPSSAAQDAAVGTSGNVLKLEEANSQVEDEKGLKESDNKGEKAPSESSSELDKSCDSESLEQKLAAADNDPLHIEEEEDDVPTLLDTASSKGLENGDVSSSNAEVCLLGPAVICIYHLFESL